MAEKEDIGSSGNADQKSDSNVDLAEKIKTLQTKLDEEIAQLELNLVKADTDTEEISDDTSPYPILLENLKASADRMAELRQSLQGDFDTKKFAGVFVDEMRNLALVLEERRDNSSMATRDWHSRYCSRFLEPCAGLYYLCCDTDTFIGSEPFKLCCMLFNGPLTITHQENTQKRNRNENQKVGFCLPNPYGNRPCN